MKREKYQELGRHPVVPVVRRVYIDKGQVKKRPLGIPVLVDKVVQRAVAMILETIYEQDFIEASYGYRPKRSAKMAINKVRRKLQFNNYKYVVEADIKGYFNNIELLMKAVRKYADKKWLILYIERWLKAPFQFEDGTIEERKAGTPQGGVISPVLANLFMHYAFDKWMERTFPNNPWARYADDAVIHCKTKKEAENLHTQLKQRLKECKLELHPEKTRIVYCKDDDRREEHENIKFDFLGYTFRPRKSKNRYGKYFINFTPAVSNKACKAMRQVIRNWRIHLRPDIELVDISRMYNPVVRGWINYYGRYYKSALYPVLRHLNKALVHWARRKYKKLTRHRRRAERWLGRVARNMRKLFTHWKMGILPTAE